LWLASLTVFAQTNQLGFIIKNAHNLASLGASLPEDRPSMDAVVKTIGKLKRQYMFLAGEEDSKSMFRTMSVQKKIDRRRKSQIATDLNNSKPLPNSLALLMKGR